MSYEKQIKELIARGGYNKRSTNQVAMLERFAGDVIELVGKQAAQAEPDPYLSELSGLPVYTEASAVAQPPAEVVRELVEALNKAEDAITFQLGGESCGLQTALIAVRAALKSGKEHGL